MELVQTLNLAPETPPSLPCDGQAPAFYGQYRPYKINIAVEPGLTVEI